MLALPRVGIIWLATGEMRRLPRRRLVAARPVLEPELVGGEGVVVAVLARHDLRDFRRLPREQPRPALDVDRGDIPVDIGIVRIPPAAREDAPHDRLHLLLHRLEADHVARRARIGATADLVGATPVKAEGRAHALKEGNPFAVHGREPGPLGRLGGGLVIGRHVALRSFRRALSFPRALSLRVMHSPRLGPGRCRGWRARRLHPKGPPFWEDRKRARPARPPGDLSPSVPLSGTPDRRCPSRGTNPSSPSLPGPIRSPGGFPVGTGPTPLRCVTRTAGRNAGGFPGRHPGTAAGPLPGLLPTGIPPARAPITSRSDRRRIRDAAPRQEGTGGGKGGGWSGDKRAGYARSGGSGRFARHAWPGS